MLATAAKKLPAGDDWAYELKWDGYRTLAYLRGGETTLKSRRDQDLTERFASVVRGVPGGLRTNHFVLDGQVCAVGERGRPSLSALQQGGGG